MYLLHIVIYISYVQASLMIGNGARTWLNVNGFGQIARGIVEQWWGLWEQFWTVMLSTMWDP